MRKFNLFKIILVLALCLCPLSCTHLNNIETTNTDNQTYGYFMYNAFERDFSKIQFDSICVADKISNNLNTWYMFSSREGDTNNILVEYMYITYNNKEEIIYRLIKKNDNQYHITKRIKNR